MGLGLISGKFMKIGFEETERLAEDLNRRVSLEIDKLPDRDVIVKIRPQIRKIRATFDQKVDALCK